MAQRLIEWVLSSPRHHQAASTRSGRSAAVRDPIGAALAIKVNIDVHQRIDRSLTGDRFTAQLSRLL
jgi:hypothetical protein